MEALLLPGRIGEAGESKFNSRVAEGAIPFGKALQMGTTKGKQVKVWDGGAAADIFDGVSMYSVAGNIDNETYDDHNSVSALYQGKPCVLVSALSATPAVGDKVAVYSDGSFGVGPLEVNAAGTTYGVNLMNAVWKSSGTVTYKGASTKVGVIEFYGPADYTIVKQA
jgi:hypothetical protein